MYAYERQIIVLDHKRSSVVSVSNNYPSFDKSCACIDADHQCVTASDQSGVHSRRRALVHNVTLCGCRGRLLDCHNTSCHARHITSRPSPLCGTARLFS